MLEQIRRIAFWTFDYLKGAPISKNYKEIKYILENPKSSKTKEIRDTYLNNLLTHSTSTCNFYKKYKGYKSLNDFPVINKNVVLDNYEDFKSETFKNVKLFKAFSSGSTGIPFNIYQDGAKKIRNTADTIYFAEAAGFKTGEKLIYLRQWTSFYNKNILTRFIQNILPHDVVDSSDSDIAALIFKISKDKSNKHILGYPSFFEQLCRYLDKQDDRPKNISVNSIISFAESLNDYERKQMETYFGSTVCERYSNQENGIIAQQTKYSNGKYVVNHASYFVEVLEADSDKHVKDGEIGRVVLTDLFNYAMPLIRYDTGDMAIYNNEDNTPFNFDKIYGRQQHMIYNTNGAIVSPFIFYNILDYTKAKQFQFIQKDSDKYVFKLNAKQEHTNELGAINYFKKYLGDDALIDFEYVDEIPLLSSGKRIKVRNDYMLKKSKN